MTSQRKTPLALKIVLGIVGTFVLSFAIYVGYLQVNYTRIPDNVPIENSGASANNPGVSSALKTGTRYSAFTYNIGFGAYTPEFTFFMDSGQMKDGTETHGEHGTAISEESVLAATNGAIQTAEKAANGSAPDFMLFQEVDEDSSRSYKVNQLEMIRDAFSNREAFYAENFHTGYLIFPLHDPFGIVNAGTLTLSNVDATATRRSYPIDESFPLRYTDLDRCFSVLRIPVEGGKELVLINNHMSAYDEGGVIRREQMDLLTEAMAKEYAAGNYVIVGGDWNHALCGSQDMYESQMVVPDWISIFDDGDLPDGFSVVRPSNLEDVASCRSADIPYELGRTYRVTVDGFVVSANVSAQSQNMDVGFAYSDHNPVLLYFELND